MVYHMKKFFRIIILCIFIGIAIFSILLVYKPGASIFHFKKMIDTDEVIHHDGHVFRYRINLNTLLFPSEGSILYEDGNPLERTFTHEVVEKGLGHYSIVDKDDGLVHLNFSASDNSNPLTNGKKYTFYYKAIFLSRGMGLNLLSILSLGLAWFLIFVFKSPNLRQAAKTSPLTFWQVVDEFLFQEIARVTTPVTNRELLAHSRRRLWIFLLILSVAAAYLYVFMEWLFFVTKPSFMDLMGWYEKIELFLLPGFALAILSLALVMIIAGLDYLSSRLRLTSLSIFIGTLIPSIILTAISLLLVDNFTYTIFNFGVVTSDGIWRFAYGICTLILFIYINNRILKTMGLRGRSESPFILPRFTFALIASLLLISAVIALARFDLSSSANAQEASLAGENNRFSTRPNILLIGSDGLNASNLSLYGYGRDTTPVLRELAKTSLLAENVFTNSEGSTGSITSMLTGKAPAQTRVFNSYNILHGTDAYQHLPGILNKEGYSTVEFGVRNYIDAYQVNMLDGFDTVNGRSLEEGEMVRFPRELGFTENEYFASRLVERISDRILHLTFIRKMENPFTIVTQHIGMMYDRERQDKLLELIRYSDRPLFVHVHMMGTHGPHFSPEQQIFSSGITQDQDDMIDFYDDSILNFDRYVGEVLDTLEQAGKINNTILIIYSDHPMKKHNGRMRIPLLIHFPNGEFAGRIRSNVQNLDIPPTILDYVGIEHPGWMTGQSLLKGDPPEDRLIFTSGASNGNQIGHNKIEVDTKPVISPSYKLPFYNVINCQKWYKLTLIDLTWSSGDIPGHSSPCLEDNLLTMEQVNDALTEHLLSNGFDTSTLQ
jgi:arylsulfatase A-like enzyme